jgi:transporter family protein
LVLVRDRCCGALWRASNLHSLGGQSHRRRIFGGFIVEASAALSIFVHLAILWFGGRWNQKFSAAGLNYSLLTVICVGAGTIAFFLLFQKGGPLSAVPAILAGGAGIMALAGILFFHEAPSWQRIVGVAFAIIGLFLLRK